MNSIRRGQLITTYGVGSMITNKENETFMLLAPDTWVYRQRGKYIVNEPHLKRYLGVDDLLQPPPAELDQNTDRVKEYARTIRFPSWHFCRKCRTLQKIPFEGRPDRCANSNCKGWYSDLIPARFLSVCEEGHIEDFPFMEWVHNGQTPAGHELEYQETSQGTGLAGIIIHCRTCGKRRGMNGALTPGSLRNIRSCSGHRPWLYNGKGREVLTGCNLSLLGVQKAASNVYFPVLRNSIYIPEQAELPPRIAAFMNNPEYVRTVKQAQAVPDIYRKIIASLGSLDETETEQVVQLLENNGNGDMSYNDIKELEYSTFRKGTAVKGPDLQCVPMEITQYQQWFQHYFKSVSLVEKLRDTRALVGFTRVRPFDESDKNIRELIRQITPGARQLPVDVVRGEGIFLEFSEERLEVWRADPKVQERLDRLPADKLRSIQLNFKDPETFVMLHTFAHILINELCLIAGYNNASLRERIYSTSTGGHSINGILIYTNSGDSEGSLGGLVRNGKPGQLEPLIQSALQKADWCSSDPVCTEVIPQGHEGGNLAACHNCCLLPETSCEYMNLSLDRGLLRGSISDGNFGFFNKLDI